MNVSQHDMDRYLSGNMPEEEKNAFEKLLLENSFEQEALEGLERIPYNEIENDLNEIHEKIDKKVDSSNSKRSLYIRIAASLILLFITGVILYTIGYKENDITKIEIADKNEKSEELSKPDSTNTLALANEEKKADNVTVEEKSIAKAENPSKSTDSPNKDADIQESRSELEQDDEDKNTKPEILAFDELIETEKNISAEEVQANEDEVLNNSAVQESELILKREPKALNTRRSAPAPSVEQPLVIEEKLNLLLITDREKDENYPKPEIGYVNLQQVINSQLNKEVKTSLLDETVVLFISETGKLDSLKSNLSLDLNEELKKVIDQSGDWSPTIISGKNFPDSVRVKFILKN